MSLDELKKFWNNKKDENSEMFISELKEKLIKGNIIPFIGAGMSKNFGYPDWNSLYNDINKEYGLKVEECNILEFGEKILNKLGGDESKLVELICRIFDKNKMHQVEEELNYLYYLTDNIKAIVTTNFDAVIEHYKPELEVCLPSNMLNNFSIEEKLRNGKKILIKLHGSYKERESIVITKKKFEQFYCEESALFKTVEFLWNNSYFLFMGCGLRTDHLINKMRIMAKNNSHYHYAILPYPEENVEKRKQELLLTNIKPIWYETNKHNQILDVLKEIFGTEKESHTTVKSEEVTKESNQTYKPNDFDLKFLDHLAKDVKDNDNLQDKLITAILAQPNNIKDTFQGSSPSLLLDNMLDYIINSNDKHILSIEGEPGTGKSTILSLLYYKCLTHSRVRPFLIDTHYYDKENQGVRWETKAALQDLEEYLGKIEKEQKKHKNKKIIVFIDGVNDYCISDKTLKTKIINWIYNISNNDIKFVYSIGRLKKTLYPEIYDKNGPLNYTIAKTIHIWPEDIKNTDIKLVNQTLDYYISLNKDKEIKVEKSKLQSKLQKEIRKLGRFQADFRIVLFLIKQYFDAQHSDFIGVTFNNYFKKKYKRDVVFNTAKYIAEVLLKKDRNLIGENNEDCKYFYLFKSESITNFFIAYYYISILSSNHDEDLLLKEINLFDCIFTRGINIFAVDLMNNLKTNGHEKIPIITKIITNIDTLMTKYENKLSLHQKNQFAFMLGRISGDDDIIKEQAKNILLQQYKNCTKGEELKELDDNTGMYIRTIGISLVMLDNPPDNFYKNLIYNGCLNRINMNFHIQYFITDGYRFDEELNIANNNVYKPENIDMVYKHLERSINNKGILFNINIITIINLILHKLFYFKKDSRDQINQAINEAENKISGLKDLSCPVDPVITEYIEAALDFIKNRSVYLKIFDRIYKLKYKKRKDWVRNNFKKNVQPFVDHTWACCQLALLFLPEKSNNCRFRLNNDEKNYNVLKIIQMLVVHDIGKDLNVKYNILPHLCNFGLIRDLTEEYTKLETCDSKIAHDINRIEPLLQIFIYRKRLPKNINSYNKIKDKVSGIKRLLKTGFGKDMLHFFTNQFAFMENWDFSEQSSEEENEKI